MKRLSFLALLLVVPSCVVVVGDKDGFRFGRWGGQRGSGVRIDQNRSTEAFHAVEFCGAGDVTILVGSEPSLKLSGDDDLLSGVTTEVQDGTLRIEYPSDYKFDAELRVSIQLPHLREAGIYGSADMRIKNMQGEHLHLTIAGSGDIQASGQVNQLMVKVNGSGDFDLSALKATNASVVINGSGDAELNVSGELDYDINGSGDIDYRGEAKASGSISGSGSIDRD
jgi:hypothetical protein